MDVTELPIFQDYAQLERHAWAMHDALVEACEAEKRDPCHLGDLDRLERIGRMDAARCAFKEWAK